MPADGRWDLIRL